MDRGTNSSGGGRLIGDRERNYDYIMETEQRALGSILVSPHIIEKVSKRLSPSNFRYEKHQIIFDAMLHMFKESIAIDVYTLYETLEERGQLDKIGRASYLTFLHMIVYKEMLNGHH